MKYGLVLADPPWQYNNRHATRSDNPQKKTKFGIGVAQRYSVGVMPTSEIADLPVADIANKDCALALWGTGPHTIQGDVAQVMRGWGFDPITLLFVWVKLYPNGKPFFGTGSYSGSNAELVWLGIRGRPERVSLACAQVVDDSYEPEEIETLHERYSRNGRDTHSRKPTEIHRRLETLFPNTDRIELFARTCEPGWHATGYDYDGLMLQDALPAIANSHDYTEFRLEMLNRGVI